jgi:hypothetical protein
VPAEEDRAFYYDPVPSFLPSHRLLVGTYYINAEKFLSLFRQGCDYGALLRTNRKQYAAKRGYGSVIETENLAPSRPHAWGKLLALLKWFALGYEWILIMDADSLVMNYDVDLLSTMIEKVPASKHIVMSRDGNGFCTGVFLIRNSLWSRKFIRDANRLTRFDNHPWWEQAAMMEMFSMPEYLDKVHVVEQRSLNAYPQGTIGHHYFYQPGDFILHFAGTKAAAFGNAVRGYAKYIKDVVDVTNCT